MKRKFTSLVLVASTMISLNAQVMIQENFTAPFNPVANGWNVQNLSGTPGQTWFAPTASLTFNSFNGAPNDYFAANWASTTNTNTGETLSNWLITPSVTLNNGGVLEFATRTSTNPTTFPDRLEVYMSTAGNGVNVGSSSTSLGTYSVLMVTVNPNLSGTGYPGSWTIYTATITGLTGPTAGRFGFRYHVTNGGFGGTNSDYIGLDAVKYSSGCGVTVQSYTVCAGTSVTLTANGALSPATYAWAPTVGTNSTLVVNPTSTTVYTLNYSENASPCPAVTSTITIGNQLSINATASSNTICSGLTVTLTATSSATSYTWLPMNSSAPSVTAAPTSNTTYTVVGQNGFCFGANTVAIVVNTSPSLSVSLSPSPICLGSSITITASGANTYTFLGSTSNPQTIASPTAAGAYNFLVGGTGSNGCTVIGVRNFTVNPLPTITASATKTLICSGGQMTTLNASGASTYTWSNGGTGATGTYSSGTTGSKTITATGTATDGCTATAVITVSVDACAGIERLDENSNGAFYPNPFSNVLNVTGINGRVDIYNTIGQLVISTNVNDEEKINTSELPKGAYVVKAYNTSNEVVKTIKLLKN